MKSDNRSHRIQNKVGDRSQEFQDAVLCIDDEIGLRVRLA